MRSSGTKLINESRRSGRELVHAFMNGAQPSALQVPMVLVPGEYCVGQTGVTVYQWLEGDSQYMHKSGGYVGGGIVGLAALRGAKAIGNSRRRANAARAATAAWREVDRGMLYMTNRRLAIQGRQWADIWFAGIRMSDTDSRSITLHVEGMEPTMLELAYADYWYVMFQKVAYDRHHMPPPPDDEVDPVPVVGVEQASPTEVDLDVVIVGEGSAEPPVPALPEPLVGRWRSSDGVLDLEADGSFQLTTDETLTGRGVVKVDGARLVLDSERGVLSFKWLVDDVELVLIAPTGSVVRYDREGG